MLKTMQCICVRVLSLRGCDALFSCALGERFAFVKSSLSTIRLSPLSAPNQAEKDSSRCWIGSCAAISWPKWLEHSRCSGASIGRRHSSSPRTGAFSRVEAEYVLPQPPAIVTPVEWSVRNLVQTFRVNSSIAVMMLFDDLHQACLRAGIHTSLSR